MTNTSDGRLIYVLDDDDAVRDSLEAFLGHRGFRVRTYGSSTDFLTEIGGSTEHGCLLLDIRMPEMDGLEVLARVVEKGLRLAVVMITGHADVPTAVKAMKIGAVDFIEKPFSQDVIFTAIDKAFESLSNPRSENADANEFLVRIAALSPRERDVMERLVDGLTNKEIARDLDISPRTVEVYRAGVMGKMEARNLSSLVKMGLAAGLGKGI